MSQIQNSQHVFNTPPVRVRFIGYRGFPRRLRWQQPFVVSVFRREPMAVRT